MNTCIAFTNNFTDLAACPVCGEPCYSHGKPQAIFEYLPVIPHLQALYESPKMIKTMLYHENHGHVPGEYSDIFNGSHYWMLMQTDLVVEGLQYDRKSFDCSTDIALGLISDGVQVCKKPQGGNVTAWPIFCLNYNIPPELRVHSNYLIALGIAPGPCQPSDHNSFLYPFYCELIMLGHGVSTWNTKMREHFLLRAHLLTKLGDMQAIKYNQYIKGPNAFSPCWCCRLQGCHDPNASSTNYYLPLTSPEGAVRIDFSPGYNWDPWSLPLRTDEECQQAILYIQAGMTVTEQKH